ncbi:hypothetical protein FRUB_04993 [Fimbriiglobus ruber]|uniref:Uncharacterized protein n=1 Tax=Fimbriiglobus ruber TaxID=1908690 RepID=A0A225DI15_9BACT|nr:hypothetical protein FRUB_04993 [Fimbriiglobus ruber]
MLLRDIIPQTGPSGRVRYSVRLGVLGIHVPGKPRNTPSGSALSANS